MNEKPKRKKTQHYVFQAYLRSWATDGKIYCLRDGAIFRPNLTGVACERFFYRIDQLTPSEVQFIEKFLEISPEVLKPGHRRLILLHSLPGRMIKDTQKTEKGSVFTPIIEELIESAGEDYHQAIEDSFLPFIRAMLKGETNFYADARYAAVFLHGMCVQFTRTKQARETALTYLGPTFKGLDTRRVLSALSYHIAINLSYNLYVDREKFKVVLLHNTTDTPFITADQPLINLHAPSSPYIDTAPDEFELFYPLSPRKAMLFVESHTHVNPSISAIAVNNYNVLMVQNSHEQVFSDSEEYLITFKNVVGGTGRGGRLR